MMARIVGLLTLEGMRQIIQKELNLDFSHTVLGSFSREYRINLLIADGGTDETAYYTDDRDDAVATAKAMAKQRDAQKLLGRLGLDSVVRQRS
jgi:hypothetical protein